MVKLNIGCGNKKINNFIGIDIIKFPNVNLICDLNNLPLPIMDNSVDEIWMDQVLEHLIKPFEIVEELYRICKNDSKITIGVPYFRSFYSVIDPTHKNYFGIWWFNYFDPAHPFYDKYGYTKIKLKINKIEFDREFKKDRLGIVHRIMIWVAEKRPTFYEAKLSHLYPLNSLTFYLTVIKE